MRSVAKSSSGNGPKFRNTPKSKPSPLATLPRLTVSSAETRVRSIAERVRTATQGTPICPDTSLPWSDDYALGGWSARMFLHQLLATSRSPWTPSDTTWLLSASKARVLRANLGSGISLSGIIRTECSGVCFRTSRMVQGLIRRALARGPITPALTTHRTRYDSRDCYIWQPERGLRILDADEREGLAGFPSGWTTGFSQATRARMYGNAAIPQVAEWIGIRILSNASGR